MKNIDTLLNQINNKKLFVIFPHPDDETVMASGLILRAKKFGWDVKVVCVTNGTLGRINVHGQGRSMIQIRREELSTALKLLGVTDFEFWRYCDGRLKEETNWHDQVTHTISQFDPGVVVSYGPSGISGHPDHLALGKFVFESQQLNEFDYQLLWPAFVGEPKAYLQNKVATADRLEEAKYKLALNPDEINTKIQALKAHQSQDLETPLTWLKQEPNEYFTHPDYNQQYNFNYVDFDLGD